VHEQEARVRQPGQRVVVGLVAQLLLEVGDLAERLLAVEVLAARILRREVEARAVRFPLHVLR
jgi:hypothetical protein